MINWYKLKRYFWNLFGIAGVVLFWAGIWDGLGNLSYLVNPLVSLGAGLIILIVSGLIFQKIDLLGVATEPKLALLGKVHSHPKKHQFEIKYYDKIKKGHITLKAKKVKNIEKSFLVLVEKGKEVFIPAHRVKEILHQGKPWKGKEKKASRR